MIREIKIMWDNGCFDLLAKFKVLYFFSIFFKMVIKYEMKSKICSNSN